VKLWIRGGDIIDPIKGFIERQDIIVESGRISGILPSGVFTETGPEILIIDASGKLIIPGMIDMHVHLREPGHEYKENRQPRQEN
jgi:dihydroorotase